MLITLAFPIKVNALAVYLFCAIAGLLIIKSKALSWKNPFIVLCFMFFLLHVGHLFFADNTKMALFGVEKKLSFLLLPILWFNLPVSNPKLLISQTLKLFGYSMSFFGFGLLIYASFQSKGFSNMDVFFYHNFVQLFDGNAIYYSLLFTLSLVIFIDFNTKKFSALNTFLIGFNVFIIVLLSSKTFFFILALILLHQVIVSKKKWMVISVFSILGAVFFFANENSLVNRFREIKPESFFELKQNIEPSMRFDGFSLRKELWDMSLEIVEEDKFSMWFGAGTGDAQDKLNKKISERGLFTGFENTENTGFLNYNSHNQYIQTFLETGLIGLIVFLLIMSYCFHVAINNKNRLLLYINIVIAVSYCTESYLSTQIGIISFVGFYSLFITAEKQTSKKAYKELIKRVFDIVFSSLVIVFLLSWLLPILGLFIYLDTRAFPIFVQLRAGKNAQVFNCFKLRTMIKNQEANNLPAQEDDTRITVFGAFLRKYAIDELPQFFNVFFGQMSVVGPRPLMIKEEKELNNRITDFSSRLSIKPGVTGLAQANGYKGIITHDADLQIRYRLDNLYIEKQTLWLDIKIIFRTLKSLIN